jgi:hypothetical protein
MFLSWFDYAHHDPSHVKWVGGPVPNPPGFPPKDGSVRSPVADPLKACGNDRLRIGNLLNAASCEELTQRD